MSTALLTGRNNENGAYLAELLLTKGYSVHGIKLRASLINTKRIDHLYYRPHGKGFDFTLRHTDLTDYPSLIRIVEQVQPDEIYNLAAQSHVAVSLEEPEHTANSDGLAALRILEAIRRIFGLGNKSRFSQATIAALRPRPTNAAERDVTMLLALPVCRGYREVYGVYACNGILFNHESPLRGETFVNP